jgi:hypothetical protein
MAIDTELKARLDDMQAQLDKLFQLHGLPTWKRQQKQKRMAGTSWIETDENGQRALIGNVISFAIPIAVGLALYPEALNAWAARKRARSQRSLGEVVDFSKNGTRGRGNEVAAAASACA